MSMQKAIDRAKAKGVGSEVVVLPGPGRQIQLVTAGTNYGGGVTVNYYPMSVELARKVAGLLIAASNVARGNGSPADLAALEAGE